MISLFIIYYTVFIKNIKDFQELQNKEIDKIKRYATNNTNNNTTNTNNNTTNTNNNTNTTDTNNMDFILSLPITKYIENRDRSIMYDPLVEPTRRYSNASNYKNLINIPTRGYPDEYQLIGLLSRTTDEKLIQLFGRPKYRGANTWEYYALSNEHGANIKIPIRSKGDREFENGQQIHIHEFKGDFQVRLYDYNTPRYIPDIY